MTTFMGKGAITAESDCYVGTLGLGQDRQIPDVFLKADLVIAVGYDLVEYSPGKWNPDADKKIVHIDFTTSEVDVHYVPEVEIVSDIRETLELLEGMTSCNKKGAVRRASEGGAGGNLRAGRLDRFLAREAPARALRREKGPGAR